jgi:hypothetical protein
MPVAGQAAEFATDCFWPILLKNSLSATEPKISGDLTRFDHEVPRTYMPDPRTSHEPSLFVSLKA